MLFPVPYRPGGEQGRPLDHCVIAVSDWETSNAFYRDVVGAEILDVGAGRFAYRVGDTQLNVHGPGVDVGSLVARLPVQPGNSDLCFVWPGPIGTQSRTSRPTASRSSRGRWTPSARGGRGTSVYFRDPDGSLLEFISYG